MKRAHQLTSLICLGAGGFFIFQGQRLGLDGQVGPGPGFFPFWIGIGLVVLSAIWFAQASLAGSGTAAQELLPPRRQRAMLIGVVVALVAFMAALRPLGFNLSMLALLLFLFFVIDRSHPVPKVVIALLGSFGVHYVFEEILRVPLPYASLSLLKQIGL